MSNLRIELLGCPRCGAEQRRTVFDSLNGEAIPTQVDAILDGTFEAVSCARCGHRHRLEHRMLFSHPCKGAWIVMYPAVDRPRHLALERSVETLLEREFAAAPAALSAGLRDARPRLVFGQHMLSEAVRCVSVGVDAALLECAKLLAIRHNLARFVGWGPCELCFEGFVEGAALLCFGVHAVASGDLIERVRVSRELLATVADQRTCFEQSHADLFRAPYVSMSRYLYPFAG